MAERQWDQMKQKAPGDNSRWVNDTYVVDVGSARLFDKAALWLMIARHDRGKILRDWQHFQNIKNDIAGPDCEAIEIYPRQSGVVDKGNEYHLFAFRNPHNRVSLRECRCDKT